MTPSETDTEETVAEAPAAPQVDAPEESPEQATPAQPVVDAPDEAPASPQAEPEPAPEEAAAEQPAAAEDTSQPATPLDTATEPESAAAPAAEAAPEPAADAPATPLGTVTDGSADPAPEITSEGAAAAPEARPQRPQRRNRQADRRKQLEELSRATAAELGREPDRRVVEKAILAAGGPDAVREFLATPQESREGKPLGWRIACLREARRHEAGGRTEEGWVTLSAVPVRQIRGALDRAVVEEGRVTFRDEAPRGNRGPRRDRGDRRPGSRDERAVADQFMSGGVASFGGDEPRKKNPFEALSGLLDGDADT